MSDEAKFQVVFGGGPPHPTSRRSYPPRSQHPMRRTGPRRPTLTLVLAAGLLGSSTAQAEEPPASDNTQLEDTREIGVLAGLAQPLIGGANIQLEATYGRFVFDYSHGMSLEIPTAGDAKSQGLAFHVPYSTGVGVGYRFSEAFDLRFEPKLHKFQVNYDEGPTSGERVVSYRTVTLGFGAYYKWRPFESSGGAAKGITVVPSLRFWPNVWSSLKNDRFTYQSASSGQQEVHETANIGLANTPFIINLSVGYVFSL